MMVIYFDGMMLNEDGDDHDESMMADVMMVLWAMMFHDGHGEVHES